MPPVAGRARLHLPSRIARTGAFVKAILPPRLLKTAPAYTIMKPSYALRRAAGGGENRMKYLYRALMAFLLLLLAAGICLTIAGAIRHANRPLVPRADGVTACASALGGVA